MIFEISEEDFNDIMKLIEEKCSVGFQKDFDNPYDAIKTRLLFQYGSQKSNGGSQ